MSDDIPAPLTDSGVTDLGRGVRRAWDRSDAAGDALAWPAEPRYRVRLPDPDAPAGLDALAAGLDANPRVADRAFVHVTLGRRDDHGEARVPLERLSRFVTVGDHHTAGPVPVTEDTFDSLARLHGEGLVYLAVVDADGRAIAERRDWTTLRLAVPDAAVDRVEGVVGGDVRIEPDS